MPAHTMPITSIAELLFWSGIGTLTAVAAVLYLYWTDARHEDDAHARR